MKPSSIRTRLTLTIALLTALVAIPAVAIGTDQVKQAVIDQQFDDRFTDFEPVVADAQFLAAEVREGSLTVIDIVDAAFEVDAFDERLLEELSIEDLEEAEFFDEVDGGFVEELALFGQTDLRFLNQQLRQLQEVGNEGLLEILEHDDGLISVLDTSGLVGDVMLDGSNEDFRHRTIDPDRDPLVVPVANLREVLFELLEFDQDAELAYQSAGLTNGQQVGLVFEITDVAQSVDVMRQVLWFAAALLVGLAGLATWILTGRALRPVSAITRRVRGISAGNLSERVPHPGGNDEIGKLATTMNAMLERIEQGDTKRRQFVSDAAHELRTPVAVLRSEAEAASRAPETASIEQIADTVSVESMRLGQIVEDLLSLARFDESGSGSRLGFGGVVDLDEVVFDEARRNRPLPIDLSGVLGGRVHGPVEDLRRVVAHLLDNAARHGSTTVGVGVAPADDRSWVELWVDDDGAGIDPADREKVFDRFVRLDAARNRDSGGSGLGLAVVAAIVRSLGGRVSVADSPLGGARFLVTLPSERKS